MRLPAWAVLGAGMIMLSTPAAAHPSHHRHERHHHSHHRPARHEWHDVVREIPATHWAADVSLNYLTAYIYSEVPPPEKPADIVLNAFKKIPLGTPIEEIQRAADAFGIDFPFMRAVAKVESDFNPKDRTGSYIGLFQLSKAEFARYGDGDILSPRDNAVAAAYKFATEATEFELRTHQKPTSAELYLIHQQGEQGAAEHIEHPDRIAWKSMCATDEGRAKGEAWCKRAIWENTLPGVKQFWKSVDNLTSGAFVQMWRDQIRRFLFRGS